MRRVPFPPFPALRAELNSLTQNTADGSVTLYVTEYTVFSLRSTLRLEHPHRGDCRRVVFSDRGLGVDVDFDLDGGVPELGTGAVPALLHAKRESLRELLGFHDALRERCFRVQPPAAAARPVVLATCRGTRDQPNLTPPLVNEVACCLYGAGYAHDMNEAKASGFVNHCRARRVSLH